MEKFSIELREESVPLGGALGSLERLLLLAAPDSISSRPRHLNPRKKKLTAATPAQPAAPRHRKMLLSSGVHRCPSRPPRNATKSTTAAFP
jgi:hypothetical protein